MNVSFPLQKLIPKGGVHDEEFTDEQLTQMSELLVELQTENANYKTQKSNLKTSIKDVGKANQKLQQCLSDRRSYYNRLYQFMQKNPHIYQKFQKKYLEAKTRLKNYQKNFEKINPQLISTSKVNDEIDSLKQKIIDISDKTASLMSDKQDEEKTIKKLLQLKQLNEQLNEKNQELRNQVKSYLDMIDYDRLKRDPTYENRINSLQLVLQRIDLENDSLSTKQTPETFSEIIDKISRMNSIFSDIRDILTDENISPTTSTLAISALFNDNNNNTTSTTDLNINWPFPEYLKTSSNSSMINTSSIQLPQSPIFKRKIDGEIDDSIDINFSVDQKGKSKRNKFEPQTISQENSENVLLPSRKKRKTKPPQEKLILIPKSRSTSNLTENSTKSKKKQKTDTSYRPLKNQDGIRKAKSSTPNSKQNTIDDFTKSKNKQNDAEIRSKNRRDYADDDEFLIKGGTSSKGATSNHSKTANKNQLIDLDDDEYDEPVLRKNTPSKKDVKSGDNENRSDKTSTDPKKGQKNLLPHVMNDVMDQINSSQNTKTSQKEKKSKSSQSKDDSSKKKNKNASKKKLSGKFDINRNNSLRRTKSEPKLKTVPFEYRFVDANNKEDDYSYDEISSKFHSSRPTKAQKSKNKNNKAKYDKYGNKIDKYGNKLTKTGDILDKNGNIISHDGYDIDQKGHIIDKNGNRIDKNGNKIDKYGNKLAKNGDIIDKNGKIIGHDGYDIDKNGHIIDKNGNRIDKNGNILGKSGAIVGYDNSSYDKSGNKIDKYGNKLTKTGDILDKNGNIISHDGYDIDQKGHIIDKNGKRIDKNGNKIDKYGNKLTKTGDIIDKNGKIIGHGGYDIDKNGHIIDKNGNKIDKNGNRIDKNGNKVDKYGNRIDTNGNIIDQNGVIIGHDGYMIDSQGNIIDKNGNIFDKNGNVIDKNGTAINAKKGTKTKNVSNKTMSKDTLNNSQTKSKKRNPKDFQTRQCDWHAEQLNESFSSSSDVDSIYLQDKKSKISKRGKIVLKPRRDLDKLANSKKPKNHSYLADFEYKRKKKFDGTLTSLPKSQSNSKFDLNDDMAYDLKSNAKSARPSFQQGRMRPGSSVRIIGAINTDTDEVISIGEPISMTPTNSSRKEKENNRQENSNSTSNQTDNSIENLMDRIRGKKTVITKADQTSNEPKLPHLNTNIITQNYPKPQHQLQLGRLQKNNQAKSPTFIDDILSPTVNSYRGKDGNHEVDDDNDEYMENGSSLLRWRSKSTRLIRNNDKADLFNQQKVKRFYQTEFTDNLYITKETSETEKLEKDISEKYEYLKALNKEIKSLQDRLNRYQAIELSNNSKHTQTQMTRFDLTSIEDDSAHLNNADYYSKQIEIYQNKLNSLRQTLKQIRKSNAELQAEIDRLLSKTPGQFPRPSNTQAYLAARRLRKRFEMALKSTQELNKRLDNELECSNKRCSDVRSKIQAQRELCDSLSGRMQGKSRFSESEYQDQLENAPIEERRNQEILKMLEIELNFLDKRISSTTNFIKTSLPNMEAEIQKNQSRLDILRQNSNLNNTKGITTQAEITNLEEDNKETDERIQEIQQRKTDVTDIIQITVEELKQSKIPIPPLILSQEI